MVRFKTLAAASALAAAAVVSTGTPAAATPLAQCNGVADSLCTYCGHYSGNGRPYPYSYCYNNPGSYQFHTCYGWALGHCYVG